MVANPTAGANGTQPHRTPLQRARAEALLFIIHNAGELVLDGETYRQFETTRGWTHDELNQTVDDLVGCGAMSTYVGVEAAILIRIDDERRYVDSVLMEGAS